VIIKQAFEVYSLVGGGYNKRHLHGYAWTKERAQQIGDGVRPRRYHIGAIHVIRIGDNWHRVHVLPIEGLDEDSSQAQVSRLAEGELPERMIPSINFQIDDNLPRRVPLDFERAVDAIAGHSKDSKCKLYTLRTGGMLPITFKIRDLVLNEHTQTQVSKWLQHEINFRIQAQENKDEPPAST
jgi:hypothetical protein